MDRLRAWGPVRIPVRLAERVYDLVYPKGQLREMGEVKFYNLPPEKRAKKLIRYIRALDLADTEDVNEQTYLEFRWIILKREHLGVDNFFDQKNIEKAFGTQPPEDVDLDDAVKLLKKNRDVYLEYIRKNRDLRTLNIGIEWVWRMTKKPRGLLIGGIILGSGMQIGMSLMSGWSLPFAATAQKESFKGSHATVYGESSPLPEISDADKVKMREFISRHNSTLDFLESPGRDDKIKIPQVIHNLAEALYQARNIQHDPVLERLLLRDLFEDDRWTRDFTGSEIGANTRKEIDHLYQLYDPDGSLRRQFESELKAK